MKKVIVKPQVDRHLRYSIALRDAGFTILSLHGDIDRLKVRIGELESENARLKAMHSYGNVKVDVQQGIH